MQAWEESAGLGHTGRSNRDFDDFDEWNDDEFGPDEESEFGIRFLSDEDEADAEDEEEEEEADEDADVDELEDGSQGTMRWMQAGEDW